MNPLLYTKKTTTVDISRESIIITNHYLYSTNLNGTLD